MSTIDMEMKTDLRPSEEERQQLIHEVALNAFVKHGYAGASMSSIARDVGGSKTTLYSRYPSKKALFLDVLRLELDRFFANISHFPTVGLDIEQALHSHCVDFAEVAQSESAKNIYRLVMSECVRLPEIQLDYSERVDAHLAKLSAAIEASLRDVALPELDWHAAARLLFDLDMNFLYQQLQNRGRSQDASVRLEEHARSVMLVLLPSLTETRKTT